MQSIDTKAAISAGLIAGLVFLVLEMVLVGTVGGGSPWGPPRMIGAMVLGEGVLPPPATFDLTVVLVAMIVHFILSVLLGVVFALAVEKAGLNAGMAAVAGLVFGIVIYFVNFYGMTAIFPWFAMARGTISIVAHGIFGLVLGYSYRALAAPRHVTLDRDVG